MRFRKKKEITIIQRIEAELRRDQEGPRQLAADLLAPARDALEQLRLELKKSGYQVSKSVRFIEPTKVANSGYYYCFNASKSGLLPVDFRATVKLEGELPVDGVEISIIVWTCRGPEFILNRIIAEMPVWQIKQYFYESIRSWIDNSRI